jgi:PAS domain S-box-containing protein
LVVLITWRERANVSVSSGRNFQEPEHHTLVEQIPAIIYVQKLDPIRSTTYLSPQTEVLLGYSPDELRGEVRRWLEIIHPDDRERVDAEVNRAVSAGESSGTEYRCIARDGRVVWVRDEAVIAEDDQGCPGSGEEYFLTLPSISRSKRNCGEARIDLLLPSVSRTWGVGNTP